MKYLLLSLILVSCNLAQVLTSGKTEVDDEFFKNGCSTNNTGTTDPTAGADGNRYSVFLSDHDSCNSSDNLGNYNTLNDGLIGYWDFQDNIALGASSTYSLTSRTGDNNINLTTTASPASSGARTVLDGARNSSVLECQTGANCNIVGDTLTNFSLGNNTDMAVAFWFKPSATTSGIDILNFRYGGSDRVKITYDTGPPRLIIKFNSTEVLSVSHTFDTGNWNHIVLVLKRSTGSYAFINGASVSPITDVDSTGFALNIYKMSMGYSVPSLFADDYYGKMDSLGIWNRELSSSEINDLYNGSTEFN